jgi:hypothetical protein
MQYHVQVDDNYSDTFASLWGILASDSASPTLFNIYFSDFDPPKLSTDITLQDQEVDHMLFADNILEFTQVNKRSLDLSNLQQKANYTHNVWCKTNSLELSTTKTKVMVVGAKVPLENPAMVCKGQQELEFVDHFQYGGITFVSSLTKLFNYHYEAMIARAKSAAHAVFATESFVGLLLVPNSIRLYYARVDPYLMWGNEVVVDMKKKYIKQMEAVQVSFLCRLMRRSKRTAQGPLLTESGVKCLVYKCIRAMLRNARYDITQPKNCYARRRLEDSIALYKQYRPRAKTWVADIETVLKNLPKYPVPFNIEMLESVEGIDVLIEEKSSSCCLYDEIATSQFLLLNNPARRINPEKLQSVSCLWKYLQTITILAHCQALTKFLCADHPFAVEQMRRFNRADGSRIAPECRICRYCKEAVKLEVYVIFECKGLEDLVERREEFIWH